MSTRRFECARYILGRKSYICKDNNNQKMEYEADLERLRFFREIQLWPVSRKLDFENWLANFDSSGDKEIAAQILSFFIYIPDDMMTQMLQTAVGKCGYFYKLRDPHWTHDSFKTDCWYSFIQGENVTDKTDSGYVFIRMLHEELGISNERIVDFSQLAQIMEDNSGTPQNVILVDDFVGSGAQCDTAWNKHRYGRLNKTLSEYVASFNHRVVFAPLIVNELGYNRIVTKCAGLHLEYIYKLGPEYSLFNENGKCWRGNKEMYNRWLDLLNRIALKEGFPFDSVAGEDDIQGFCKQGLALAFEHCIPDACSSIFYKETDTWKPLKFRPRDY